jgi:hypothetical protein
LNIYLKTELKLRYHQIYSSKGRKRTIIYCNHCRIKIRGNKDKCPLCSNILPGDDDNKVNEEIYPEIPPAYERHLAVRIMVFISIVFIVASFVVYTIFPSDINWPIFIVLGLISMWLSLIVIKRKRHNITKNIMWQVIIVSLLSIVWDWRTGSRGWSLDYLIPILCVAAMIVMYVTARVMKLRIRDYIAYFLLDGLFGIVPVIFILFDLVKVWYPSAICVATSIIFLSAIIIFQGENIRNELNKRMHI